MTSITGSLYTNLNAYTGLSSLAKAESDSDSGSGTAAVTQQSGADTVSLSAAVSTAKAREYFGLAPTGKLTFGDFETAVQGQKAAVSQALSAAREALGIPEDQKISLSLDKDGKVAVSEKFSGKKELETYLNEDEAFVQSFSGLSTNSEVIAYARSLTTTSFSLADYMGGSDSGSDLISLAQRYSTLKSARSLEDIWRLSRNETPFTYTHGGEV